MELVYKYEYDETPDYVASKALFAKELKSNGWKDDKNSVEWLVPKPGSAKVCEYCSVLVIHRLNDYDRKDQAPPVSRHLHRTWDLPV